MLYLFVLGRDSELSKLEIEAVLESKGIEFAIKDEGKSILVIDCKELNPKIIEEFGGIIKIAKVISSTSRIDQIEENLESNPIYEGSKNKIEYYIDAFNTNLLSFLEDYLKDYFRSIKLKALYKKTNDPSKLVNKNILEQGINFLIFKNYIGKVIAITNPLEFKKRDMGRPEVDYMRTISIRLAKILINISKVKYGGKLLDPFCGTGTVLQEALLKGINVLGIDNDLEIIEQAKKNLNWLKKEYKINNSFEVIKLDSRDLNQKVKENSINGVVTEPYMGPYIRKLPTMHEARELVIELSSLYDDLLNNLNKVLMINSRVVIIIPKFKTRENKNVFLDFKSIIDKHRFTLVNKPINYGYKENKLLREIYILEKN